MYLELGKNAQKNNAYIVNEYHIIFDGGHKVSGSYWISGFLLYGNAPVPRRKNYIAIIYLGMENSWMMRVATGCALRANCLYLALLLV